MFNAAEKISELAFVIRLNMPLRLNSSGFPLLDLAINPAAPA
jgi:hypothetical protein